MRSRDVHPAECAADDAQRRDAAAVVGAQGQSRSRTVRRRRPISCGFTDGQRIIIFDETGAYDDMTLTQVQDFVAAPAAQQERCRATTLSKKYGAGAQIAQVDAAHVLPERRDQPVDVLRRRSARRGGRRQRRRSRVRVLRRSASADHREAGHDPAGRGRRTGRSRRPSGVATAPPGRPARTACSRSTPAPGTHASRLPDLAPSSQALVMLTASTC